MKSTSDILSQWYQMINIIMQLNENLYMDDFKGAFFKTTGDCKEVPHAFFTFPHNTCIWRYTFC